MNILDLARNMMFFATAEGGGSEGASPELPNFVTVLHHLFLGTSFADFIHKWENLIFSLIAAGILIVIARLASRKPAMVPGLLQNTVEYVVEELEKFIVGVLGPRGKEFVPFLGTLFLYILP